MLYIFVIYIYEILTYSWDKIKDEEEETYLNISLIILNWITK